MGLLKQIGTQSLNSLELIRAERGPVRYCRTPANFRKLSLCVTDRKGKISNLSSCVQGFGEILRFSRKEKKIQESNILQDVKSRLTQFHKFSNNVHLRVKFTCHILIVAFVTVYSYLKSPLRRVQQRNMTALAKIRQRLFSRNGQLSSLFCKDTQLLIVLFSTF